jgi:DNA polymerase, archaea type
MNNYKEGVLLDSYYKNNELFITIKNNNNTKEDYIVDFNSYFYISFYNIDSKTSNFIKFLKNEINCKNVSKVNKNNISNIYKIEFDNLEQLIEVRTKLQKEEFENLTNYTLYEYDIPFIYRFFIDYNLFNFKKIEFALNSENKIIDIKTNSKIDISKLNEGCFDIEVLVSENLKFPQPKTEPIISISYLNSNNLSNVFFLVSTNDELQKTKEKISNEFLKKNTTLHLFDNEIDLLNSFKDFIIKENPDIIYTYNGVFDFEYILKRYKILTNKEFSFDSRSIVFNKFKTKKVHLEGIIHFDVYKLIKLLNYFQVFNYSKFDLNSIYSNITGSEKIECNPKDMRYYYLSKNYKHIINYNLDDCFATMYLAKNYIGFVLEISQFLNSPIIDILYSSASGMVEKLFIKDYLDNNLIIPNKPTKQEIYERYKHTFTGAFVYQPSSGLYKDLAVLDFRSYHISLLITYNISPETINVNSKNYKLLFGQKISTEKIGFVPNLLKRLLNIRIKFKEEMKTKDSSSIDFKSLYSKQFAIKILLASTYGYLGFAGSRWYCPSCLELMYLLVRNKIKELISTFEAYGYQVVYGDTDSCFLKFTNINKLKKDVEKINATLPKDMFLELESLFKSAIFVKSRGGGKAAKKKYAMLDYNNNLKIKGFEYVRRDWCILVKNLQKKILEIVLDSQNPKIAVNYIKDVVYKLKNKEINNSDLVIQSIVHKNTNKYKTINPAVFAIEHAKKNAFDFKSGDLVEYIITNIDSKNISSKARISKLVKEKDYDVNYYLNNQLIPAVHPILEVFGITKDELLNGKKQTGIKEFF